MTQAHPSRYVPHGTPAHALPALTQWAHYAPPNTLPPVYYGPRGRQPAYRELVLAHVSKAMLNNAARLWGPWLDVEEVANER